MLSVCIKYELGKMGFHGQLAAHGPKISLRAMPSVCWRGVNYVHYWTLEQWNLFSKVMHYTSLSARLLDLTGFGGARQTSSTGMHP